MRMVVPNDPVRFLGDLVGDMSHLADSILNDGGHERGSSFSPRLDVVESGRDYRFFIDLPGVASENVSIDIDDDELRIEGKREFPDFAQEVEGKAKDTSGEEPVAKTPGTGKANRQWRIRERGVGSFRRTFRLPEGVDQENVAATFENGVLTLVIPKLEKPESKRVEIKVV